MSIKQIEIPPRARKCCVNQENFLPGNEYYSLLEQNEQEEYHRKDYCPGCWKQSNLDSVEKENKIFWKSKVPQKTEVPEKKLQKDKEALAYLKELLLLGNSSDEPKIFVLALFLARNKLLRCLKEVKENGLPVLLYEVQGTEEILCIKKIELSTVQAEEVRKTLTEKFTPENNG